MTHFENSRVCVKRIKILLTLMKMQILIFRIGDICFYKDEAIEVFRCHKISNYSFDLHFQSNNLFNAVVQI